MGENLITKESVCVGMMVDIISDGDRATQDLTRGYVKEIVTKDSKAKKITVILTSGKRGTVKHIVTKDELKRENFKFYNLFFFDKNIKSVWDKKAKKYFTMERKNKNTGAVERIAFLFNDSKKAQEILKELNNPNFMLRNINRNKPIVENFKTLDVEFFSINKSRKLPYERLLEWESFFKNMR